MNAAPVLDSLKMTKKPYLLDYDLTQWETYIKSVGEKTYRAKQVYDWLHKRHVFDAAAFSNIPDTLKDKIQNDFYCRPSKVIKQVHSDDGTEKILLELREGRFIETVLLRNGERITVCVSTQAGCSLYCEFCMTARGEFKGNLSSGEILEQVYSFARLTGERISNIVFMGMGEPLMNYENSMKAAAMLNDPHGLNIGVRRITISTSGVLPGIKKFIENNEPFNLALSVHSFNPQTRAAMMDAEKKWPISGIMDFIAAQHTWLKKNRISFEYIMILGMNMSDADAAELSRQAKRIKAKISLIPLNFEFDNYHRPTRDEINTFWEKIKKQNVEVFNRASLGYDIKAACGMLRSEAV